MSLTDGRVDGSSPEQPEGARQGASYLVLRAGERAVAVTLDRAREVVRAGRTVRIPGAKPPLEGLLGVRGDVVAVVDLPRAVNGPSTPPATGPVLLLQDANPAASAPAGRGRGVLGLRVTSVEDIVDLPGAPGAVPPGSDGGPWSGSIPWGPGTAGVLDVDALRRSLAGAASAEEAHVG